jgi:serine/threonine-protein kinase
MTPATPSKLGRYDVIGELGKGAMGVVYLARDPLIGRLVALKTFRTAFGIDGEEIDQFRRRFLREAQSAGILSHPNIVTVHDVVEASPEGATFIAMEYVRGVDLKDLLRRGERLTLGRVADIVEEVAEALDYAHSRGVVHRDVKPANIILTEEGRVKITDFGIARLNTSNLTQEGQLLGTPNYMAPEQILGHEVDHRADVFSLGVVLFELLTRHKPFAGDNLTMVSHRIAFDDYTPPRELGAELPPDVEAVLRKALHKEPAARYQSAGEMARELRVAVALSRLGELDEAGPSSQVEPPALAGSGAGWEAGAASGGEDGEPPESGGAEPTAGAAATGAETSEGPGSPSTGGAAPPPPSPSPGAAPEPMAAEASMPRSSPPERQPPASPAQRRRASATASSSSRRRSAARILGAALAGSAVIALLLWSQWPEPVEVPAASALDERRVEILALLRRAQELRAAGDPLAAATVLRSAERLAPGHPGIARRRAEAEREARERSSSAELARRVGEQLELGRAALAAGRLGEASSAAQQALAFEPGSAAAAELLAAVAARRGRARAPARPPAPAPARAEPRPAAAQPAASGAAPLLVLDFLSELPEGTLTLYSGGQQLLLRRFRFVRRTGVFRSTTAPGRVDARHQLPAGDATLRLYVTVAGQPAKVVTVEGSFAPGTTRTLHAHLARDGTLSASLQ